MPTWRWNLYAQADFLYFAHYKDIDELSGDNLRHFLLVIPTCVKATIF